MISFKQYLEEAKHRQDVSIEKAVELIQAHCKDAMKHLDTPLHRGSKGMREDAYVIQGELGGRDSANSSNHYTIILDEVLPSSYPKRSKSIILGNYANKSVDQYSSGGGVYAIFPYDGTPIGVCAGDDIWEEYVKGIKISKMNAKMEDWGVVDYTFIDLVESLEQTLEEDEGDADAYFTPGKVEDELRDWYSEKSLRMQLATPATVYGISGGHELWFGGKCVAINMKIYESVKAKLK